MDHLAVMRPSWKLTSKILSGKKKIESRWYKNRSAPWNKIRKGDAVYFKEGEFVFVKADVKRVLQFENLTKQKVKGILDKFGEDNGIEKTDIEFYFNLFKDKKYCILIFLKNTKKIKPFKISKKGFGSMASWLCIEDVNKIRV